MIFNVKSISMVTFLIVLQSFTVAANPDINGYLYIVGTKTLNPEMKSGHNLDALTGLGDLNLSMKTDKFETFLEVYLTPEDFGSSYLKSATIDSNSNKIITENSNAPTITFANAWGRFNTKYFQIQIGRAMLKYSNGFFVGDYLQKGSGPVVDYSGNIQNCLSIQNNLGIFTTSILLGTGDINLDKGYMTFREIIKLSEFNELALGYQGNIFDPLHDKNSEVLSNLSVSTCVNYIKTQKFYAEFGIRGLGASNNDMKRFPFMLGFTVPTSNILSSLTLEAEYDKKRETLDSLSSFSYGLSAAKYFNDHFETILSLNNGLSKNAEVVGANLELFVYF